jgi:phosphoglycolate phosphatase
MSRLNTIVFDYDGTLHDTSKIYITAFGRAYAELVRGGYAEERVFRDSEITRWLGCTSEEMWNTFMPSLPESVKRRSAQTIRTCMAELIREGRSSLFAGTAETLALLKSEGRHLVVLSNCAEAYMENHRRHFGLDELFDGYFCAETYKFIPKAEIFEYIKSEYGGEYCMVGDRFHDFEAGKRHCALTVGCRYGFGGEEELKNSDIVIDSITELPRVLAEYESAHGRS